MLILLLAALAGWSLPAAESGERGKGPRPSGSAQATQEPEILRIEDNFDAMGTTYSIVAYGADRSKLRTAVEQAFEEVQRLDRMMSNYRPDSELSQVNKFAADGPVKVSAECFDLISGCVRYSRESEGAFDITVGPLMRLWGFYKGSGRLPHRAELRGVFNRIGYKNVILDRNALSVRFARRGVELDPGGIGKGYAVDRLVPILKANGIEAALISASGSSIYAIGAPPNEKGWKVKIRDPKSPSKTIQDVVLRDNSMSTSGNYEKFFWAEGKMYSHIMDPRTGYPATGMLSVSVIAPHTLDSEVWAKPYYILGRKWAAEHKPRDFRVFLCEDRSEQACAWLQ
ncbi:MAG: FAD:protein FMN transferase [Acidobacteria bacterium]|nr:FAD:protein FMN transferase [Acidobacteriota bacterium]